LTQGMEQGNKVPGPPLKLGSAAEPLQSEKMNMNLNLAGILNRLLLLEMLNT